MLKLIKLCVSDNVFSCMGKHYTQIFGMAIMGNPLSPLLANIYMDFYETIHLPKICSSPLPWYRYVDDVLCCWNSNSDPKLFLEKLNSLVPSINFKMEIEQDHPIFRY